MSLREDVNWEEVKGSSISELAQKSERSDIADVVEYSGTLGDVFDLLGKPHFLECISSRYSLAWFASDGWLTLTGSAGGSGNLTDIPVGKFSLVRCDIASDSPKGYRYYVRQEDPWGGTAWRELEGTDKGNHAIWQEKVGT